MKLKDYQKLRKLIKKRYKKAVAKGKEILDLSDIDVSAIDNFHCLFYSLDKIKTINLTGWKTSQVKDMSGMFEKCINLEEIIGLEQFDTRNVKDMRYMFYACTNLQELNLNNFRTDKVEMMKNIFLDCVNLKNLNFSTLFIVPEQDKNNIYGGTKIPDSTKFWLLNSSTIYHKYEQEETDFFLEEAKQTIYFYNEPLIIDRIFNSDEAITKELIYDCIYFDSLYDTDSTPVIAYEIDDFVVLLEEDKNGSVWWNWKVVERDKNISLEEQLEQMTDLVPVGAEYEEKVFKKIINNVEFKKELEKQKNNLNELNYLENEEDYDM